MKLSSIFFATLTFIVTSKAAVSVEDLHSIVAHPVHMHQASNTAHYGLYRDAGLPYGHWEFPLLARCHHRHHLDVRT